MKPKHLTSIQTLTRSQIEALYQLTHRLKKEKNKGRPLAGKTLGLLFLKPSVRTRVSFEVGMDQLGGQCVYMGPVELGGDKREKPADLARVLSRYLNGIVLRTFSQEDVEELAKASEIPVINGLSDVSHPCQALSDLFTLQEKKGKLSGLKLAYVGDGNNVCHSLLEASALMGVHLTVATPKGYEPHPALVSWAQRQAKQSGAQIQLVSDPAKAVVGADGVYTDVWTSMGKEEEKEARQAIFKPFQVNRSLLKKAKPGAIFMHCLPAHRGEEVTDEVMDSKQSIVYDQAENRLHVQKAILRTLLG